jgi:signal peptidase II
MMQFERLVLTLLVVILCVGCDQATKALASRKLSSNRPIVLIEHVLHLEYTENTGAMMSVGSELPDNVRFWLFSVFAGCALCAILVFTILDKSLRFIDILSLSFILGGGLGNLVDRIFKGGVVIDFMILSLGTLRTAIFNVADLSIVTGLFLLVLSHLPLFSRAPQKPG